jgi:hypothetical protein
MHLFHLFLIFEIYSAPLEPVDLVHACMRACVNACGVEKRKGIIRIITRF